MKRSTDCEHEDCFPTCGLHEAGCFFGGPPGDGYWFAVEGCPEPHDGGDSPPLMATAEAARDAWGAVQRMTNN